MSDYDLAIPELMDITTPRADGVSCTPLMKKNYAVVVGLMLMQTPKSDLDGIVCVEPEDP